MFVRAKEAVTICKQKGEVGPVAELENSTPSERMKIQLKNNNTSERKHMVAQTQSNTTQ